MMRLACLIVLLVSQLLCINAAKKDNIAVIITNHLSTRRMPEMVELDARQVAARLGLSQADATSPLSVIITDAKDREIPSQITSDGKIIFLSDTLETKEKRTYHARISDRKTYESRVFGRIYPERQEDFSFENDRIAYRLYGPETRRKEERLYGYDLFNKRTTALFLDELYADQTDSHMWSTFNRLNKKGMKREATALYMAFCYHIDHGKGMDCYKVGPTLGAGTNALISQSDISYPWTYTSVHIDDCGPLRLRATLDYGKRLVKGIEVSEKRILTLDAGSSMVKSEVVYSTPEGVTLPSDVEACCGIVVHNENPEAYLLSPESGTMAYEDLGDVGVAWEGFRERQAKEMGKIYIGTYVPTGNTRIEMLPDSKLPGAKGHVITRRKLAEGGRFTYYFGTGWDRNPATGFTSLELWEDYLKAFSRQKASPLGIKIR